MFLLTSLKLDRNPGLALDPCLVDAVVVSVYRYIYQVAPFNNLETSVRHIRLIDSKKNSQMFDILDVRIRSAVNMRREPTRPSEFIVESAFGAMYSLASSETQRIAFSLRQQWKSIRILTKLVS